MKPPRFVRPLSDTERELICSGLRSSVAFPLRRSQSLRASADGQTARQIARQLGWGDQTVRNVIRVFATEGVACLTPQSSRPKRMYAARDASQREPRRDLLHQSPRVFGKARSPWTRDLLADECVEQG
jgi:transposase